MKEKEVTLTRKKTTPFTVNYPIDGRIKKYIWLGTKGSLKNKKNVPFEVFEWLSMYTSTLIEGDLILEKSDDIEVNHIRENIEGIDKIEDIILTKDEIIEIFKTGNHLSLKSKLKTLTDGRTDSIAKNQKRYIVGIAKEIGIDSNSKRKVLCEWAGIDYENSDLLFDSNIRKEYEDSKK